MAYCPEDGAHMNTVCLHYNACYHCPECGTHWNYVDGTYAAETSSNCPVHNHCKSCRKKHGDVIPLSPGDRRGYR